MKYSMGTLVLAGSLVLAPLGGCTRQPEPAQSPSAPVLPDPGEDQEYEVSFPEQRAAEWRYIRLAIGDDLSRDCGLVQAHFQFDSSQPLPQDTLSLKGIADCLNRPELEGMQIDIVGRADSRGNSAYNLELGRKRAENVKKLLVDAGVAEERIRTASKGASEAVGNAVGAYSFGYDRRVDVSIAATSHRPR